MNENGLSIEQVKRLRETEPQSVGYTVFGGWARSEEVTAEFMVFSNGEPSKALRPRSVRVLDNLNPKTGEVAQEWQGSGRFSAPPSSNTVAQNTNGLLIDYLAVTFKNPDNGLQIAQTVFGPGLPWTELDRGGYGYTGSCSRGSVKIYHGGRGDASGTVLVVASGDGCRQLEDEGVITDALYTEEGLHPWQGFLSSLVDFGVNFPRIDFALDDTEGLLDLDVIDASANAGHLSTHFKEYRRVRSRSILDGSLTGDTLYFGSRHSNMWVRVYNKGLEQLQKGIADTPDVWTRAEVEAKNSRALALVNAYISEGAAAVAGVLRSILDFKDPNDNDTNKCRRQTVDWWLIFLDHASKYRLMMAPASRTVEKVVAWLARSVAPSLHMVANANGGGMGLVHALIEHGGARLRSYHLSMLAVASAKGNVRYEIPCFAPCGAEI